jgi:homoserine dehydrogenase
MHECKLSFIGFGNVGRALARLLLAKRDELSQRHHIQWRVVAIATRRHGAALDPDGLDLSRALQLLEQGGTLAQLSTREAPQDSLDLLHACQGDVLFENTPVNYETGQPAIEHIRTALALGMHAITANKGPVVHGYTELTALARTQGRRFLFESSVMDGAPIFSLWREALPAARLLSFRGILNSTTNLILTLIEEGQTFAQAVAHAQAIGVAESDPSGDTQGWDAAVKVAALCTVLMGTPLTPQQVARSGIEHIGATEIAAAAKAGKRWKLICAAEWTGGALHASVQPLQVAADDPLYHVMGTSSAVTFHSDVLGPLTILEQDPGPATTAYGLLADFIVAVRDEQRHGA